MFSEKHRNSDKLISLEDEISYIALVEKSEKGLAMRRLRVLLAGSILLYVSEVSAGVVTCNLGGRFLNWASMDTPFELNVTKVNPAKNVHIGLGSNIQDYTVLYQIKRVNVGVVSVDACIPNPELHYTILRSDDSAPVKIGADYIYKTSVPGIGISLESYNVHTNPLRLYPQTVKHGGVISGLGMWLHIKIWKIPGTVPVSSGPISFTGPTVGQILLNHGDTFATSNPERLWDNNKGWVASSRQLQGTLIFEQNTCNLEMGSKTVLMGKYDGSGGGKSAWKDASFRLNCPNAWGYGGTATSRGDENDGYNYPNSVAPNSAITANTQKNGPLRIQIIPRTPVVDAAKGILALDGSGAKGYGIQLAWGEHGTLGAGEPAKPVILNSWTKASELNSAYRSSEYVPGATVIPTGADGTIRMAARYIRTTGSVQPGPANAAVEVIASYQ